MSTTQVVTKTHETSISKETTHVLLNICNYEEYRTVRKCATNATV